MYPNEYEHQKRSMEDKLKAMAQQESLSGSTMGLNQATRPGLRERIAEDLRRSNREASRAVRLAELDMLLDKHPDVARILELLEEARG